MRSLLLIFLLLRLSPGLNAQYEDRVGHSITCFAMDSIIPVLRPAPADFLSGQVLSTASFDLDFAEEVPAIAQASLRFAAAIWGSRLRSEVPIRVQVDWESREDPNILASAGPTTILRDFPGALSDTWYPVALAEAIIGSDVNDGEADIRILVNSDANWYFGIDGLVPGNQLDLATVAIHELGHGLGFLASVDTLTQEEELLARVGFNDLPIVFDQFVEDVGGNGLLNTNLYPNPSAALLDLITVEDIYFAGMEAVEAFGDRPPLFSPGNFDVGSSVSHLCEFEFRPGTEDALMSPQLARREAIHDIGPVVLGIMNDLGWPVNFELPTEVRELAATAGAVYPNPARGAFTVEMSGLTGRVDYELFDFLGRKVQSETELPAEQFEIDPRSLAPGTYLLVVRGAGVRWSSRLSYLSEGQ